MEQNAELRILLQIRSTIKSGVTEGLRNRCKQVRGSAARFTPHFPEILLPAGKGLVGSRHAEHIYQSEGAISDAEWPDGSLLVRDR